MKKRTLCKNTAATPEDISKGAEDWDIVHWGLPSGQCPKACCQISCKVA